MRLVTCGWERGIVSDSGCFSGAYAGRNGQSYGAGPGITYGSWTGFPSYYKLRTDPDYYFGWNFPQRDEIYARIHFNLYYGNGGTSYPIQVGFKVRQTPALVHDPYGSNWQASFCSYNKQYYYCQDWDSYWVSNYLLPGIHIGPSTHGTLVTAYGGWTGATGWDASHWLELHIKVDSVNGIFEVRLDGNISCEYHGNTDPMGVGYVDQILFDIETGIWDDFALNDVLGTRDTSWPGVGVVIGYSPTADGYYTAFSGAGYSAVTRDGSGVNTCAVEGQQESYIVGGIANPDANQWEIKSVSAIANARKQYQESFVHARQFLRIGGNDYYGADQVISYSYSNFAFGGEHANSYTDCLETNPATGLAWTLNDLTNIQIGTQFTLLESTTTDSTTTEE